MTFLIRDGLVSFVWMRLTVLPLGSSTKLTNVDRTDSHDKSTNYHVMGHLRCCICMPRIYSTLHRCRKRTMAIELDGVCEHAVYVHVRRVDRPEACGAGGTYMYTYMYCTCSSFKNHKASLCPSQAQYARKFLEQSQLYLKELTFQRILQQIA